MDIRVPRLGEGVSSGTVVNILVSEGDQVKKDQTVLELETEKAVAPIPSPEAGVVTKIYVKEGDAVAIGQPIISLADSTAPPASKSAAAPSKPPVSAEPSKKEISRPQGVNPKSAEDYSYQSKSGFPPPASPSVRKLAKDLGIDLARVKGSERGGRIVLEDVKVYIAHLQQVAVQKGETPASTKPAVPAEPVDFSKWGSVSKKPVSNLRRTIGQKMADSWTTVPHVTQFDEADITDLMALRKKVAPAYEKKGTKLTLTSFILKAAVAALKKYPVFNSSLDEVSNEIVTKNYYHLGVAVDAESGLIVPVIHDVDKKNLLEVSIELEKIAEKTRQRKISLEELQGGTFNISNLGSIGGTFFTPIITKPQVAVLGVGRGVQKPVAKNQKVEIAILLPMGLSYDHRVIDGADGARFIREIVQNLENFNEKEIMI